MADRARVTSIDELKAFKGALLEFAEQGRMALASISADVRRAQHWVECDQWAYWNTEVKRRTNALAQARIDLQRQELAGKRATDERRALNRAKRRLAEAQQKVEIVKRWRRLMARDLDLHTRALQQLATTLVQNVPDAAAAIDRAIDHLDAYLRMNPPTPDEGGTSPDQTVVGETDAEASSRSAEEDNGS